MSFINNSILTGLAGNEATPYQTAAAGEFAAPSAPIASDAIAPNFWGGGSPYGGFGGLYGGSSSGSTGLGGFAGIMNGFMNLLSNALTSLGNMLGGGGTVTQPGTPGYGAGNGSRPMPETYFANATASSTGDPHDALDATTAGGTNVDSKWNSMGSHAQLLDSDSFAGGYRVSTSATAPNANGVTYNQSASIVTDGGATNVTMNAGGGYEVTENGQSVSLQTGQTTALNAHESVTLNADGSLTVADTNVRGGSIDTTLQSNGPGVDVTANASHVELGGYLVNHTDQSVDPTRPGPWYGNGNGNGGIAPGGGVGYGGAPGSGGISPFASAANPFGTFTSQLGASSSSLADIEQVLQNDAV